MTQTASSRWLSLAVLCAGVLMIVLDQTIVNVALPSIQADLGFSQSGLAWVVNAYLVAFAGLLLLAGRMGDLLGRRAVFLAGLGVFTAASLLCGVSTNAAMLIGARFLQGLGGAATTAVVLGMIVTMFAEPSAQAKAMGVYSFVAAAGGTAGLLLGGVLTQALNWHWIFFVNVPIGLITATLTVRVVERDRGVGLAGGADGLGAVLITGALMLGVYTIVDTAELGSAGTTILGLVAFIGLGIGIMFPAVVTLAMAGVGPEDSGLASGLINTSAQVGGALGLAILATIAAVRSAGLLASGLRPPEALASGFDLAFAVAAVLFAVAIVITLTVIRDSASDARGASAEPCVAQAA